MADIKNTTINNVKVNFIKKYSSPIKFILYSTCIVVFNNFVFLITARIFRFNNDQITNLTPVFSSIAMIMTLIAIGLAIYAVVNAIRITVKK
jgi:hypothetical protein